MVFTTTTLFKGIPCPEGERCALTNCIFAHDLRPQAATETPYGNTLSHEAKDTDAEPATKRRRVTYNNADDKPPSRADVIRAQLAQERTQKVSSTKAEGTVNVAPNTAPQSLTRPVSPPSKTNTDAKSSLRQTITNNKTTSSSTTASTGRSLADTKAVLNPRLIPHDPAGHAKRSLYLKHLHGEMARLNNLIVNRPNVQFKSGLTLLESELVQLALDEEEKIAREQGNVYANVIKNRIAAYRKMNTDAWISYLKTTSIFVSKNMPVQAQGPKLDPPKVIETGLYHAEEVAMLSQLVIKNQKPLAQHGYVPSPPTIEQAEEAAKAVEASKNYEICDRCTARFQVYPHRNEEGLLTSNGPCKYHPKRKAYPQKTKADTGPKEPYYPCCNELVGTPGCTKTEWHVYKASSPARMAAVLPFVTTPENEATAKDRYGRKVGAVAFDCEMGYTTLGLELIRITAVSWPQGEELVDVLVRPLGVVLDLNSQFSGVWPDEMAKAVRYRADSEPSPTPPPPPPSQLDGTAESTPPPPPPPLTIVDSPVKARELLCSYLTPQTPLIGHAIENDLNAVRLCHPTIVDTVISFPHPRGLPMRYGLRMLSAKYLNRAIQTGGDRGHDSLEDARATGDLVRVKVGEKWKFLKATGWTFVRGELVPPTPAKKGQDLYKKLEENEENGLTAGSKRKLGEGVYDPQYEETKGNGLKAFLEQSSVGEQETHRLSAAYLEDE